MKIEIGPISTEKYGAEKSIQWLNGRILNYISSIYGPYGFKYLSGNKDIEINDMLLNTEYIDKMVNNYTVFRGVISSEGIQTEDEFYEYFSKNLPEIYHWRGRHFYATTLPVLINTSKKGNIGEQRSLEFFKSELAKRGIEISFIKPSLQEDVKGIDSKFAWNGKEITIQVKPYASFKKIAEDSGRSQHRFFSPGSLSLATDYLILYKDNSFFVIKGRDAKIEGSYFAVDSDKIVAKKI